MTKKLPIKQNKAGKWIDAKTGRFVSKSIYEPVAKARAEKQAAANVKRAAASKEYWNDVKSIKNLFGITDTKEARAKLKQSPKYVEKRGHKAKQWVDFWKKVKQDKMNKEQRAAYKQKLEDDDIELISF